MPTKTYRVGLFRAVEQSAQVTVEAENETEAEDEAFDAADRFGLWVPDEIASEHVVDMEVIDG